MTIPESHLAQEAIAALVDGELPSGPAHRAAAHLSRCLQCRMAVQAQREAKDLLHRSEEVAVPGDLLSRLQAIPFTTDVPSGGGIATLAAGPDQLTVRGASGSWSIPLETRPRRGPARWLRRGVTGTVTGLGIGVVALALTLPADSSAPRSGPVAGPTVPDQHTAVVPPVMRTMTGGSAALPASGPGGPP